jgi:hypothetical protein
VFRHCAIHARRQPSWISRGRIGRAGTPAISVLAGTSPVTIDPTAMTAWSLNGHAGKDRRTNWCKAGWTGRFHEMEVRIENGHQAPPTTMLCVATKTRSPSTREPFLPAPKLGWCRLTSQEQASAHNRPAVRSTGRRPSTVTMAIAHPPSGIRPWRRVASPDH